MRCLYFFKSTVTKNISLHAGKRKKTEDAKTADVYNDMSQQQTCMVKLENCLKSHKDVLLKRWDRRMSYEITYAYCFDQAHGCVLSHLLKVENEFLLFDLGKKLTGTGVQVTHAHTYTHITHPCSLSLSVQ